MDSIFDVESFSKLSILSSQTNISGYLNALISFVEQCTQIGISIFAKTATVAIIGSMFLPLGLRLDKSQMRSYIAQVRKI